MEDFLEGPGGGEDRSEGLEGGNSKGFVERVFKLNADVFIGGNGKVVGNREENRIVDWKVGKL